jgi:hypothetical protein
VALGNLGITFGGVLLVRCSKFVCVYGFFRSPYSASAF